MAISGAATRSPARTAASRSRRSWKSPTARARETYLASGEHYWNSGIFLIPAALLVTEMERLHPATLAACRTALERAKADLDFLRLDRDAFATCENISLDYAVMEHTRHAAVVPVEMGWSDVGTWDALWQIGAKDAAGNVLSGDVVAEDSQELLSPLGGGASRRARGRGSGRGRDRRRDPYRAPEPRRRSQDA